VNIAYANLEVQLGDGNAGGAEKIVGSPRDGHPVLFGTTGTNTCRRGAAAVLALTSEHARDGLGFGTLRGGHTAADAGREHHHC
jgi:hypothetical protein